MQFFQGFQCILFTPDEAAQIIAACEERLPKAKVINAPFSVADIQGGILKEHLSEEDYAAPLKVIFPSDTHQQVTNDSLT